MLNLYILYSIVICERDYVYILSVYSSFNLYAVTKFSLKLHITCNFVIEGRVSGVCDILRWPTNEMTRDGFK